MGGFCAGRIFDREDFVPGAKRAASNLGVGVRGRLGTNLTQTTPLPPAVGTPGAPVAATGPLPPTHRAEKGHFFGILGQKTPKNCLKNFFDQK